MGSDPKSSISTGAQVLTITKYTFLNYLRSKRFLAVTVLVLIITGILTFAVAYTRSPVILASSYSFYSTWWGMSVSFILVITVALFAGDAIAGEFQNKTGYYVVPNPTRRSTIYVGKYLAALVASTLILLLFFVGALANGAYYFGTNVPGIFLESALFGWIYMIAALSFTFMFSSLFKSSMLSILLSVIILLFVMGIIAELSSTFFGIEPWFLLSYGEEIVTAILMTPYPAHKISTTVQGARGGKFTLVSFTPTIPEGLVILAVYFVVCGILGLYLFERKEFT
ncbi:MAG TPA: ABC transporter permease [Nitrososphaerales archaeon]|nr:ABC transporter permease [Nitrososphaerales archaeon]